MADENTIKEEVAVEAPIEPVSEPEPVSVEVPEEPTAQIPVNEPLTEPEEIKIEPVVETPPKELPPSASLPEEKPLASLETEIIKPEQTKVEAEQEQKGTSEIKVEPKVEEVKPEPISESKSEPKLIPEIIPAIAIIPKSKSLARELLVKARNMVQFRKRKKLDKIMTLFAKQTKITNDEVEKFLHISDATTGRYLAILVKEGKIKQTGKTGKSVFYSLVK